MARARDRDFVVGSFECCEGGAQLGIVLLRHLLHFGNRRQHRRSRKIVHQGEILKEIGEQQYCQIQACILFAELRILKGALLIIGLDLRLDDVGARDLAALLQFAAVVQEVLGFVGGRLRALCLALRGQESVERPHHGDDQPAGRDLGFGSG